MSKTVWIINQYSSTPSTGLGGRHFYFARELARKGYNVYLVASASHHLLRNKVKFDGLFKLEPTDGFTMVWVNLPDYEEAHSKQRVINWFLFPWKIQKLVNVLEDKPDVVLCSSPSPIAFLGAQRLAKKFKARMVFEVRDIWPLTLTEIGGYSSGHPFIRLMSWIEGKAYRDSDAVISNLKNAVEHMVSRGMSPENFFWIPNGVCLSEVESRVALKADVERKLPKDKFIVGYTGTLGMANAVENLIQSARRLQDRKNIHFVIVGGGKEKSSLQVLVENFELNNVTFVDPIPKAEIQSMLAHFDVCFIGWLHEDLYRYGIGANKIPEYLYAAKPIIHAYSGKCDPVMEAQAGVSIPAEDTDALTNAIDELALTSIDERKRMGINGHNAALKQYDYAVLTAKLEQVLFTYD